MATLFAAQNGDVGALDRYRACGDDLNAEDYDGRTALHVAASEGNYEVVMYLIEHVKNVSPKDR